MSRPNKQICPICKGTGSIKKSFSNFEKKTEIADKHSIAYMLRESGYSIREIMKFLGYKSPNTIQSILKGNNL